VASPALQKELASDFALPREGEVSKLARHGLSWSSGLLLGQYAISMGSTAVLARLLSPSDYGLLGMVATFTVFVQAISDFGLSWATVQRETLTRDQIDALFWINSAFGVLLMAACWLVAPSVSAFYHQAELAKITLAASVALLFSAVAVQPMALMRRQMKLKELSLCNLCGLSISAALAVFLAFRGFGYWALIAQLVSSQAVITLLSFPCSRYFPRIPQGWANVGSLLTFGGYSAGYGLINYFARNLDNVLVGKFWGAASLGYYSRAYFLMTLPGMMIVGIFSGVLIPAMASLRKEPARMEQAYLRALRAIVVLGCSLAVGLAAVSPEAVDFIYGPKWRPIVAILLWLAAAGILQPIQNIAGWLHIVAEDGRGLFVMGLIVAGSATIAFSLGIHAGPIGVARAYAIANTLIAYPVLRMAHRACGLSMQKTIAETLPLLLCSLIMGVVVWTAGIGLAQAGFASHSRLALKILVGCATYAVCVRQFARPTYCEILTHFSI